MRGWKNKRWDWWAPVYDPIVRALSQARRRSIELAAVHPADDVLIPGAGTGLDLEFLPASTRVTALERSPRMLSRLQARAQRTGHSPHRLLGDATSLPFESASFDCVLLHLIVAVVDSPLDVLRESRRVLRSGGRIVVFDKFAPDEGSIPLTRRLANPLVRLVATDITLRLGPLAAESGLCVERRVPAGVGGLFQAAVLRECVQD